METLSRKLTRKTNPKSPQSTQNMPDNEGKKKKSICLNDVEGIPKTLYKNRREKKAQQRSWDSPRTGEPRGLAWKAGTAVQTFRRRNAYIQQCCHFHALVLNIYLFITIAFLKNWPGTFFFLTTFFFTDNVL